MNKHKFYEECIKPEVNDVRKELLIRFRVNCAMSGVNLILNDKIVYTYNYIEGLHQFHESMSQYLDCDLVTNEVKFANRPLLNCRDARMILETLLKVNKIEDKFEYYQTGHNKNFDEEDIAGTLWIYDKLDTPLVHFDDSVLAMHFREDKVFFQSSDERFILSDDTSLFTFDESKPRKKTRHERRQDYKQTLPE